jgi:hypothetical protein
MRTPLPNLYRDTRRFSRALIAVHSQLRRANGIPLPCWEKSMHAGPQIAGCWVKMGFEIGKAKTP